MQLGVRNDKVIRLAQLENFLKIIEVGGGRLGDLMMKQDRIEFVQHFYYIKSSQTTKIYNLYNNHRQNGYLSKYMYIIPF